MAHNVCAAVITGNTHGTEWVYILKTTQIKLFKDLCCMLSMRTLFYTFFFNFNLISPSSGSIMNSFIVYARGIALLENILGRLLNSYKMTVALTHNDCSDTRITCSFFKNIIQIIRPTSAIYSKLLS